MPTFGPAALIGLLGWSAACLLGCGTPAAPSPPSLNLPALVDNLSATRAGDLVTFTWTLPRRTTDRLLIQGSLDVIICRIMPQTPCIAMRELTLAPNTEAHVDLPLTHELAVGPPRPVHFAVQVRNRSGHSAGLSNETVLVAGQAPPDVEGFGAQASRQGVLLRWSASAEDPTSVRLIRTRITPEPQPRPAAKKPVTHFLAPPSEPANRTLWVEANANGVNGRALDTAISVGEGEQNFEYRAQHVVKLNVDGRAMELAGPVSAPVSLAVRDVYAPDTPLELVAAAASSDDGPPAARGIDLSWQPSVESGLIGPTAGYIVYRQDDSKHWTRISTERGVGPAFHDANVLPGQSYTYAVSAMGSNGKESPRSEPASETMPQEQTTPKE